MARAYCTRRYRGFAIREFEGNSSPVWLVDRLRGEGRCWVHVSECSYDAEGLGVRATFGSSAFFVPLADVIGIARRYPQFARPFAGVVGLCVERRDE